MVGGPVRDNVKYKRRRTRMGSSTLTGRRDSRARIARTMGMAAVAVPAVRQLKLGVYIM